MVTKKNNAVKGSTQKKELKIHYEGVAYKFLPYPEICVKLVGYIPYWLPAHIYFDMVDSTRAYNKEMARLMVDYLCNFLSGEGRKLTGIDSVDNMLLELYRKIYECALEKGENLEFIPF